MTSNHTYDTSARGDDEFVVFAEHYESSETDEVNATVGVLHKYRPVLYVIIMRIHLTLVHSLIIMTIPKVTTD
jgi:hypothetical protein